MPFFLKPFAIMQKFDFARILRLRQTVIDLRLRAKKICMTIHLLRQKNFHTHQMRSLRSTTMKHRALTLMLLLIFSNVALASWLSSLFGFKDDLKKTSSDVAKAPVSSGLNVTETNIKNGSVTKSSSKRSTNSTITPMKHSFDDFLLKKVWENVDRLGSICELIFIGDSFFYKVSKNKARWTLLENNYGAINLGSPGDRSEHLLHRYSNGNILSNITAVSPLVVLMVGISNANHGDSPSAIVDGISATIKLLKMHLKKPKILLMSLLPRLAAPVGPILTAVNAILQEKYGLVTQNGTYYLDITSVFITWNATLKYDLLNPDKITPNAAGQVRSQRP